MLNAIAAVLTFILFTMLSVLGVDWITIGHGLNPWIAFPMAALFAMLSVHCALCASWDYRMAALRHRHNKLMCEMDALRDLLKQP